MNGTGSCCHFRRTSFRTPVDRHWRTTSRRSGIAAVAKVSRQPIHRYISMSGFKDRLQQHVLDGRKVLRERAVQSLDEYALDIRYW